MIDERVTQALTSLADHATPPPTSVASDLARGRRRLRVRRATTAAGGVLGAAAVTTAVLVGSHALQPDAAPRLAASGSVAAPAGDGSLGTTDPVIVPEPAAPSNGDDLTRRTLEAVNRHLAPDPSRPLTRADPLSWDGLATGGDDTVTKVQVAVPFGPEEPHPTVFGVRVSITTSKPPCNAGQQPVVCRTVKLGGVSVIEQTYATGDSGTPDYWRKNTYGSWVGVNAMRGTGAGMPGDASFTYDSNPYPELGFAEADLGPLLADPALDVPFVPAS